MLYGRCDEDLGAPYQPFAEALRSLVPCVGTARLRGVRGVEALLPLVPALADEVPDLAAPARADPDTERYALFDAVVAILQMASTEAPIVLVLDDLHWAAKPTLLLLRHLLRFGDRARVQIVGTYRSTDLDRAHPLAAMLADLHRDGTAKRINLSGLDEDDVTTYVAEAGYDDEELGHALASVTGGNPFFLIEALRHVDESGGVWDPSTLPQGVREAVSRRLSRLPVETNKALSAAAVVGSRFALDLVEQVVGDDLVDAFDEASKAGIVIEEPGGRYRFNHAIVRQSLLAELPSMRRMRLHQRIATTLENQPGADDELLAELAHHYFECAWAGNAAKAVEYGRRAAEQAMTRLAYEGAADLYDHALHALDEIDDELGDRDDQISDLLVARCEALLAAGDVASAAGAVSQLQQATVDSARLSAWATCFDGQLSVSIHPERLDDVEAALSAAARKLAEIDDAAGEAKAHTVRATCLARLGRIGDCEVALDDALTAARRARDHRRVNAVLAGAPLAALWGPNPVPRAGGRCLDVVRLLRITTDSPAVEATSTRCQAVLEAFRGRDAAARRMIDSARRTVTELGLRHALLEVEQFAGIVELVLGDPAAAEPHLRQACNGFRRMGLDADTAETAALLGRACLALNRNSEADELCTESERLAGHALKASIAWRTLRAQLLSRSGEHDEARRVAQAAITLAERTDGLVDHGDACLSLAKVLAAAGDAAGARAAAERSADLYERKGAAALADRARSMLAERVQVNAPSPPEAPVVETHTAAVQASERVLAAADRGAWDEFERLFAPEGSVESRRKVVGFKQNEFPANEVMHQTRLDLETGVMRINRVVIAVRGERLALARTVVSTADVSPGSPQDEFLQVYGIDEDGRINLQVWFDLEDMNAAIAEIDALQTRFEAERSPARRLENAASQVVSQHSAHFAARDWDALAAVLADDILVDDRRRAVNAGIKRGRDVEIANLRAVADVGITYTAFVVLAARGERLILARASVGGVGSAEFSTDALSVVEINSDNQIAAIGIFELDDFDSAIAELDARYLAGEAAAYAHTWSGLAIAFAGFNRRELPKRTPDWANIDHRRGAAFAAGDITAYVHDLWNDSPDINMYVEVVHRLSNLGVVITQAAQGTSQHGFEAEWRENSIFTFDGDLVSRIELFDEDHLEAALARFDQLGRPAPRLENAATKAAERLRTCFAARDWDGLAEMMADDIVADDRRRIVGTGIRHGRQANVSDIRVGAEIGTDDIASSVIAIRGERISLDRARFFASDGPAAGLNMELLRIVEVDNHNQMTRCLMFDSDDFHAAIAELDARYLAGEAAPHARTWSVVADSYAGFNRRELASTTPDWVNIDHRRGAAFAPGDMNAYVQAAWVDSPDTKIYIEAVHCLSEIGAVVIHLSRGISQDGFDAEWRDVHVLAVEGDMVSRSELFDESDFDAALARFEELQPKPPRLENTASRVNARLIAYVNARDWDSAASILADDHHSDDRRRVTGTGTRRGRDADIENFRVVADLGAHITVGVIATRGDRLILTRNRVEIGDKQQPFIAEFLGVVETDLEGRVAAVIELDLDDIEAAVDELDARYLAGEAAAHAHTWSVISGSYAAINRHEMPSTTPDCVNIDHRRETAMGVGDLIAYIGAGPDRDQDNKAYVETVHRLTERGAVVTYAAFETSQKGFDAEWRGIAVLTVDGELVNRTEIFDDEDLDAALASFEQLHPTTRRLENTATRVFQRLYSLVAAGEWHTVTQITAENVSVDDRRRVVNAGILYGRDANIKDAQATVDVGFTMTMSGVLATRGERLALTGIRVSGRDPEGIQNDALQIMEVDAEERIAGVVVFDLEDFDAAIAELDVRYLSGEAAAHANTWSVIAGFFVAHNRRELAATTPDAVSIDHRSVAGFAPGEGFEYIRAGWDLGQNLNIYIEIMHRLNEFGAVFTFAGHGTSHEGFEAEWRGVTVMTVDGEMVSRMEVFDEGDLDAALAKFDQLSRPTARLENAASQLYDRLTGYFASRDWAAMAQSVTPNIIDDDRRRMVNTGVLRGRDAMIANARTAADLGTTDFTSTVIAIRADRLALCRTSFFGRGPNAFRSEALHVVESDVDERVVAHIVFDLEDIDSAFAELDARYLAGEAAAHARMWTVIAKSYASLRRQELPAISPGSVFVDHRRAAAFGASDLSAYIRAGFDLGQNIRPYCEAVHRLSDRGAVCSYAAHGVSQEGFDAEWHGIDVTTVDGDLVSRCEFFDEDDLEAAIAAFDQLNRPPRRLDNTATQAYERIEAHFAARDWDAMAEVLADDVFRDDRRRVVGAERRTGRDAVIAEFSTLAEIGVKRMTFDTIAIRGSRLVLSRARALGSDQRADAFRTDVLSIAELDTDERTAALITFDPNDFDTAFEELDARYLVGEAAADADTWSVITSSYAAFNRHELPAVDWDTVDHRRATPFASSTMTESLRAIWDLTPDLDIRIEAVHRLNNFGAVITHEGHGSSREGFDAEWRAIDVVTVEGDRITGCEIFDEADLDAALVRFDELQAQVRRLENAATRTVDQFFAHFAVRDWDAMAEILADDVSADDRRSVVNAGIRRGRDHEMANWRATDDLWTIDVRTTVATRGEHIALIRFVFSSKDRGPQAFSVAAFAVVETNDDNRIAEIVAIDADDRDTAFTELDTRFLAGEAAAHAHTWTAITKVQAAYNRHEVLPTTADWVNIDHRRGRAFAPGDTVPYLRVTYDVAPNVKGHIEVVHRLNNLGVVVTAILVGTSQEGFGFEWREVALFAFEGDMVCRLEIFDESDLDAALVRFEELQRQPRQLENAASRVHARLRNCVAARDWNAVGEILAGDIAIDDRRRAVNSGIQYGRDAAIADMRGAIDMGLTNISLTVLATRGVRLELCRMSISGEDRPDAFRIEFLSVVEINADEQIVARVAFDLDDIDAAFEELDARYLAGEGSSYADTWSVIAGVPAGFNRKELPATTPDPVYIDHRPLVSIEEADLAASIRAVWDITSDATVYIEAVHRLSERGAVFTEVLKMTSQEGFDAELRMIMMFTVEGGLICGVEVFDEADLDTCARSAWRARSVGPVARQRCDADVGTIGGGVQSPRSGRLSRPEYFRSSIRRPASSLAGRIHRRSSTAKGRAGDVRSSVGQRADDSRAVGHQGISPRTAPRLFPRRCICRQTRHRRDDADRRGRRARPTRLQRELRSGRHRCRLRGARCALPRRRSSRARARVECRDARV